MMETVHEPKEQPVAVEVEQTGTTMSVFSDDQEALDAYTISWRTILAFLVLSLAWSVSTGAIVGPNTSIAYIVQDFPSEAASASWIANTGIFCIVTLPPIIGATSDRYGKKWFILAGALMGIIGSMVSAEAKNMKVVIGGQALSGVAQSMLTVAVPAGMEIVPAKYRLIMVSSMAIINGTLGPIGFAFIFAAFVENGMTWRWGFKVLGILDAVVAVVVVLFYNPPPTRFRRQQSFSTLLKSIDFIGIGLLSGGAALLTIALVWAGTIYAWSSAYVVPFLVIGPLVLVAFCFYEWKGRSDGIMHHQFFVSRSFAIFMAYGFVDGMLLYGLSVFIPDQVRGVYDTDPLAISRVYSIFNGGLLSGFLFFGYVSTAVKQFRWPLVGASFFLTLFLGLVSRATPDNLAYFEVMMFLIGFFTASTEVIPVAGMGLIVPSHLIATAIMVLSTMRALGGALGISILSAVYSNKAAVYLPQYIGPVLAKAKVPTAEFATIITIVAQAPALLAKVPGLTPELIGEIVGASQKAAAKSYMYVWFSIMATSAACLVLSFFIVDSPEKFDNLVESALEPSKLKEVQKVHV